MVSTEEEFVYRSSRVLHNFKLPPLKWGSRKVMRSIKPDDVAAARDSRRVSFRFSPEDKSGFERSPEAGIEGLGFDFPVTAAERRLPAESESEMMSPPWNLRTRRTAVSKSNSKLSRVREKRERERARFSLSLSKAEIEEDFMAITGNRVPRRPKKRSKNVQKQLDMLFPGMWLPEVTADLYKVSHVTDSGKKMVNLDRIYSVT